MKRYFKVLIIIAVSFISIFSSKLKNETSITDVDAFGKRVFQILIHRDSIAYKNELEITDNELKELTIKIIKKDSVYHLSQNSTLEEAYDYWLKIYKNNLPRNKKKFLKFSDNFLSQNILQYKCKYISTKLKFEEKCRTQMEIQFSHEGKKYLLNIMAVLLPENKWKLFAIDKKIIPINKSEDTILDSASLNPPK